MATYYTINADKTGMAEVSLLPRIFLFFLQNQDTGIGILYSIVLIKNKMLDYSKL
jgi:hypothetical protein